MIQLAKQDAKNHEKALFDLDGDVNELEEVAERYKIDTPPKV